MVVLLFVVGLSGRVLAIHARVDTENVPIDRVVANLERHVAVSPREAGPPADWHILSLSTAYEYDPTHPDEIAFSPRGVTFRDGSSRPTYDVILRKALDARQVVVPLIEAQDARDVVPLLRCRATRR
jgi:hypothetical protein